MRHLIKFYIIAFISISTSCQKVLDTKPTDFLSPLNYYNTAEELQNGLNGVYNVLGSKTLYGRDILYGFYAQSDEEAFNIWLSSGALAYCFYQYTASTPEVGTFWASLYTGINGANTLLANINKPTMPEAQREKIKGEALFLRGYYYFLLVTNFGDVPLITTPSNSVTDVNIKRSPVKEVYEQILSDMTTAEKLLQNQKVTTLGYSGKVTKTAVQGILARVCLQMAGYPLLDKAKYKDAKAWSYKVITSEEHQLNPDYSNIFIKLAKDEYDVKESIWEVEFYGYGIGGIDETNQATGPFIGILCSDERVGYSSGRVNATKKLFDSYEVIDPASTATIRPTLDLRRDWNCANYNYGTTTTAKYTAVTNPWLMNAGKWRREYELSPMGKVNGMNITLLRYSDVLLMYAEAANEVYSMPTDSAYTAINLVRRRGYGKVLNGNVVKTIAVTVQGTGYTTAPVVTITGGTPSLNATATAIISAGKVTAINVVTNGKNYQGIPTITLTGGGGTGAVATATLSNMNDADIPLGLNKEDFFDLIVDERSRELCFEGYRRPDLLRWGKFVSMMESYASYAKGAGAPAVAYRAAESITTRNLLMPIPSKEITLNKLLTQNPGW